MLIIEEIKVLDNVFYKVYSNDNKYIRQISTNMITTEMNTLVPNDFEETNIEIEVITNE